MRYRRLALVYKWSFETIANMTPVQQFIALDNADEEEQKQQASTLTFESFEDVQRWRKENKKSGSKPGGRK